jgi:hypothetical protein
MPRKRKHMDLRGLDSESTEYWEETLHRADLQMARGRSDRLSYVGDATQVEKIHGVRAQDSGRVVPSGEKPD